MPIKIIIFEDNKELRNSLQLLFSYDSNFECTGSYENCLDVLNIVGETKPDLILMDIDMPGVNGIDAVSMIKNQFPETKILMHTVFEDAQKLFAAIKNGASGYILKKAGTEKLKEACMEMMEGGAPISPSMATWILKDMVAQPAGNQEYKLTEKEKEVLAALVQGLSYKMIADHLSISIDTVRAHIKKIYEKLHVHSMSEAVAKAIKNKLV